MEELSYATIQDYIQSLLPSENDLYKQMTDFAHTYYAGRHATILSGHLQGHFLSFLSTLLRPQFILEIGTFIGYSALRLAEGLMPTGELHTIELNHTVAQQASNFFNQSIYKKNIHLHIGDAKDILIKLIKPWDIVFIDANKSQYIYYFDTALSQINPNGLIIIDNLFANKEIVSHKKDYRNAKMVENIRNFTNHIIKNPTIKTTTIPIRDGIMLVQKKQ